MSKGLFGHFEEYLEGFFHKPQAQAAAAPAPVAKPVAPELDASLGALQSVARELALRMRSEEDSAVAPLPDPEDVKKAARVQHQAIEADILKLHQQMGTGLGKAELAKLQADLAPLLPYLEKEQGGVVERTYFHVLSRVLRESGELAWSELMDGMQTLGIRWPEPGGLSPTSTPEEREAARQRSLRDAHPAFLNAKPEHISDRVFGLVRVWRASYPPQGSDLWLQQTLFGVASGRQLQLFEQGAGLLMSPEGDEIKARLREAAQEALAQVREVLDRGAQSLADVNQMLVCTDRLSSEMAPELVWQWLKPRLGRTTTLPAR